MNRDVKYTGFFIRFVARIIDGLILYIPLNTIESTFGDDSYITIVSFILIWWLYDSFMISSSWGATFGKKILSIKVLDYQMQRVTFKKATIRYIYSIFSYMIILPLFMVFFTQKKQTFHDYFANTIVVDDINKYDYETNNEFYEAYKVKQVKEAKKKSILRTVIIIIVILLIIPPLGYMAFYMSIFYKLYSARDKTYNNSFYTKYYIKDYNNSKIDFYNSELERHTKKFIDADDIYTKFETDVKKDISLNCIEYFIEQYDNTRWYDESTNYRNGARNKYANTEEKIQQAKDNEKFMSHNFYTFDANLVRHKIDDITRVSPDSKKSICDDTKTVNELYTLFLPLYIQKFDEINMQSTYPPQQREIDWFEVLKTKYPVYFQKKAEKEKAEKEAYQQAIKDMEAAKIKQKSDIQKRNQDSYTKAVQEGKNPLIAAIIYKRNDKLDFHISSGDDINVKNSLGRSALFIATAEENLYAVEQLLKYGAEMNSMDKSKTYTAFTWLISSYNVNMKIVKLFLDNGVDVNYQYKKSEPALTVAAKGCENFQLVKLLLNHKANPKLVDKYGYNTKSALPRYCRDKQKLAKMTKLIEGESSFFYWQ